MQTLSGNFLKLQVKYFRVIGFDIIGSKRNWLQPWKTIVLMVGVSITQFMVVSFSIANFEDIEKLTDALTAMIMNHLSLLNYLWDNRKLHNFLISCGILNIASFGVVLSTIALDTFYVSLTHNLVALFKTAQYKMQFFAVTTPQETNDRLRDIIYLYKVSLDMSNRLKHFFRLLICIQMVLTSVHLCVLNFTLSYNFGQPQMFFYIVFIIAVLIQLLIYCHCGEYLKTTSQGFAVAIYDSPWYETIAVNPAIGRYLQISMMRSQRAIQIDGYFFAANMEVFLSVNIINYSNFILIHMLFLIYRL
ncbi:putative odorant receptor 98b [Drosophila albomicans]|uniref:Odorant receptor 98b n=1 Tax=Drosophila albomicans TaxID=7291 RepID=A0A9C6WJI6_DROAB|nr:putative odorant receptor 98b [Drosophila albomicans]